MKFVSLPLLLPLLLLVLPLTACQRNEEEVPEGEEEILLTEQEINTICNNDFARAHRAAEKLVEESVGVRSSYGDQFSWLTDAKVKNLGDCTYEVQSQLESEDIDGNERIMKYRMVLQYQGEGKWRTVTLEKGKTEVIRD